MARYRRVSSTSPRARPRQRRKQEVPVPVIPPPEPEQEEAEDPNKPPKLDLDAIRDRSLRCESVPARTKRYEEYFTVSAESLRLMVSEFIDELHRGLESFRRSPFCWQPHECSFKMLDSCVATLPTGNEKGVFYGLDFGGTNFRAVRVELQGNSNLAVSEEKRCIAKVVNGETLLTDPTATATDMFNFFAATLKRLMIREGDEVETQNGPCSASADTFIPAGFTFSFPCTQRSVKSATLLEWTKGFETGRQTRDPVEGCDVAQLMDIAMERHKMNVRVEGVLNDTVGTLLSSCYTTDVRRPPCLVGVVLGTGFNACYVEQQSANYGYNGKIINLECGNFNRKLPQTNVDHEVDFAAAANRGKQQLEKMLSGAYLGEICRRTFIKILQHTAPALAWIPFSLPSECCSAILEDETPNRCIGRKVASAVWQTDDIDTGVVEILRTVCKFVFKRSAALAAVVIAATAKMTGRLQPAMGGLTVAVDGSLYKCAKCYRRDVREYLDLILERDVSRLIHITTSDDGSGKGAAILAGAIACKRP